MTKKSDIITAYYDNLRNNQIGGEKDGIDPEVAEDLGYESPKQLANIIENVGKTAVGMPDSIRKQIDDLRGKQTPQTPISIRQEVINARIERNQ
ncbi:MAG: hypothetical protein WCJ86_03235 [Candidatus Saccharibacteria bacterium]